MCDVSIVVMNRHSCWGERYALMRYNISDRKEKQKTPKAYFHSYFSVWTCGRVDAYDDHNNNMHIHINSLYSYFSVLICIFILF